MELVSYVEDGGYDLC